ncbi:MAG: NAD(P)H-dependent oxidoreductase [Rhodospirillales bacterium]
MKTLLIVWHSRTGGAQQMAEAMRAGAADEPSVAVRMVRAETADSDDLLAADGYIFATPENLAAVSGSMKDFFDRVYYPVLGRIEGRPYAAAICAGSDGESAARQIARIVTGWRLRPIAKPLIVCTHAQTPELILASKSIGTADIARCAALGAAFAAGLDAGIF